MTHASSENSTLTEQHSDRELLRRFVQDGDERAFAQIVVRHAPLVMSVCRRVVGQSADVDDAFQATFFALSRRPHSIYECLSLAGWLYSVAFRASVRLVRLRKRTMMQALPEHIPTTEPDPLDLIAEASDLAALDEELNGLPEKYRNVLVMSYFAQHTNQEIADQLKESKGAVDGRIRDARKMLRVRLARRGVEIGVLTIAAAMTQSAASAASPALLRTTIGFGSSVFSSADAESMLAVNETQLNLLTSSGFSIMSIKSGIVAAASLLALTAIIGISRLAAIQDSAGTTGVAGTFDETATASGVSDDAAVASSSVDADVVIEARDDAAGGVRVSSGDSVLEAGSVTFTDTVSATMNSSSRDATAAERPLKGAFAEFSRRSERTAERELNLIMAGTDFPDLEYPGEESLGVILSFIADDITDRTGRIFRILPDVADPDIASIDYLDLVSVTNVSLRGGSMTLASALDLIFARVKDQELTWIVKNEVLMITTVATAESEENLILRSYDISRVREQSEVLFPDYPKFIGGPVGGGGSGGGGYFQVTETNPAASGPAGTDSATSGAGSDLARNAEDKRTGGPGRRGVDLTTPQTLTWEYGLMQVVMEMTSPPCLWIQNGFEIGTLAVVGNRLIVRQTRAGHEAVIEVLDELEDAAAEAADIGR